MNNNTKLMELQINEIAEKKFKTWKEQFIKEILEEGIPQSIERGQFNEYYFKRWIKQNSGFEE